MVGRRLDQQAMVQASESNYIMTVGGWDASPIVIEKYKLLFFTVPKVTCSVWKHLFRQIEGHKDWKSSDGTLLLPHNPEHNGLKYLYHYTTEEATDMMNIY